MSQAAEADLTDSWRLKSSNLVEGRYMRPSETQVSVSKYFLLNTRITGTNC